MPDQLSLLVPQIQVLEFDQVVADGFVDAPSYQQSSYIRRHLYTCPNLADFMSCFQDLDVDIGARMLLQ